MSDAEPRMMTCAARRCFQKFDANERPNHKYCVECKRAADARYRRRKKARKEAGRARSMQNSQWKDLAHEERVEKLVVSLIEEFGGLEFVSHEIRDMLNTAPATVRLNVLKVVSRIIVEKDRIDAGEAICLQEEIVALKAEIRKKDAVIRELKRLFAKFLKVFQATFRGYTDSVQEIHSAVRHEDFINELFEKGELSELAVTVDGEDAEEFVD